MKCVISRMRSRGHNIVLPYLTPSLRSDHTTQLRVPVTRTINSQY